LIFWPSQISGVQAPKNLYISDHAHPMARHVAKFHRGTPFTPKATGMDMSNFKPIWTPFEKNCKGDSCSRCGWASKTWSFSSTCKKLGAQHPL